MNSLKNHLSLIIPLVALLFALESILLVNRTLSDYESKLGKNYAIVLASNKELKLQDFLVLQLILVFHLVLKCQWE